MVRSWLLLEQPGPWGVQALTDSRLPTDVGVRLDTVTRRLGIRALLIRRHGRGATAADTRECLLVRTGPDEAWIERVRLPDPGAVLDLDLAALAGGQRLGLEPVRDPVFLVCTHGRHDPCCAERGRPVAAVLAAAYPRSTWECSHVGGDRFAGNLLCFPHGLYYGRVGTQSAARVAAAYAGGRVDLDLLRGRSSYPFAVQAAETYLRRATGITGVDELRARDVRQSGDVVTSRFTDSTGRSYVVRVRARSAAPRRLSCHDEVLARPPAFDLLGVEGELGEAG